MTPKQGMLLLSLSIYGAEATKTKMEVDKNDLNFLYTNELIDLNNCITWKGEHVATNMLKVLEDM